MRSDPVFLRRLAALYGVNVCSLVMEFEDSLTFEIVVTTPPLCSRNARLSGCRQQDGFELWSLHQCSLGHGLCGELTRYASRVNVRSCIPYSGYHAESQPRG